MKPRLRRTVAVVFSFALVVTACSAGGSTTTTAAAPQASSTTAAPTTTVPGSDAVSNLQDVRDAVVRIVAEGSFVDPVEGLVSNSAGSGSGFIIDPSGVAVTNNHVVTGAAILRVYVEGDDEPHNARVLGVSECSDLAVIQIDGDGDFPYLAWFDGPITAGLDIYAAGFPLGDPEYTLTEGIVSKEKASGESSWSSIDSVLEHTAQILPGNSGGPLVTDDGRVVGINYAAIGDLDIQYAISRDEADKVVDQLRAGTDVTSIGVNGEAFTNGDLSGIWVAAVESGSPADRLGITGGDVITKMEGLELATDGTMADYCDILRSNGPDEPMSVEIVRFDTQEVLEGTLNGDGGLQLAFSFADELGSDVADTGTTYTYTEVRDDDGILVMQVPTTWTDIDGRGWEFDGEIVGNTIVAAPNLTDFYGTWTTPGVFFGASAVLTERYAPGGLLDVYDFSGECTLDGRYPYEDPVYSGDYTLWTNCGGTDTLFVVIEAYPPSGDFVALVQIQVVTDADLDALDTILASFDVDLG